MSGAEIVIALICSIVSLILGWYGREWIVRFKSSRLAKDSRRIDIVLRERGAPAIIDSYVATGEERFLGRLSNGRKIPVLTKDSWHGQAMYRRGIVFGDTGRRVGLEPDPKAIARRQTNGERLWDGRVLFLGGISETPASVIVKLTHGSYFQYLTVADSQRNVLYRNARPRRPQPMPAHELAQRSIDQLTQGSLHAQAIGMGVAVVLNLDGRLKLLLQHRSSPSGVAYGYTTLVPCMTLDTETIAVESPSGESLPFELRVFFAHFLEKLFDREDQDWFYGGGPIRELLDMNKTGDFVFKVTGLCFDGFTGEFHIAAIALVKDPCASARLVRSMKRDLATGEVEIVEVNSQSLWDRVYSDQMYPTAAFGFHCAIDYLCSIKLL